MKLAIVIPWFGRELKGGAELQAWQIASRLAARRHEVEVLTTCCRSHQDDWATNHLPAGVEKQPEGFAIRRFPVVPRDRAAFDAVCSGLMNIDRAQLKRGVSPVSTEASAVFVNELIKSPELLEFLGANSTKFDWFLFLPYLYGPILHGISLVADRAAFQPCLHDEGYAYLPEVADAVHLAAKLLFNSDGEMELGLKLFGPGIWSKSVVVGEGVESVDGEGTSNVSGESRTATSRGRYVLYLGRKEEGKNTPLLLRAFRRFRATRPNSDLQLVLAGHGDAGINGADRHVTDLGVVEASERDRLLAGCTALFQPSEKESFSRVMMEAWMCSKPVAANAACLATAVAVERSGGGWIAESEEDWAGLFAQVARTDERELARLGSRGQEYARELADWDAVMERYEAALPAGAPERRADIPQTFADAAQINQFLPNLSYGDAISNHAIWIRDRLREFGFTSHIFVRFIDERVRQECHPFSVGELHKSDAVIYHHSIGTEITPKLLEFQGPKCVVYHNITPAEFVEPFRPEFAQVLRAGREDLPNLAPHFAVAVGDSSYNVAELQADGFHEPTVLPIAVDPAKWNFAPAPDLIDMLQDGRTNILFVGRIAPNKKQDELVAAFNEYLEFDPTARLILVGKAEENDPYAAHLGATIERLGPADAVMLPGSIADMELHACYRTAHLFWSMSEHEGFCVPLIEAMWFDVPVLAFRSSAIPETLGGAGLMFTDKSDLRELAALARVVIKDRDVREKMIAAQRRQRQTFLPDRIMPRIAEIANRLRDSLQELPRTLGDVDHPDTTPESFPLRTRSWPIIDAAGRSREINQCLPNLSAGDAVSNQAIAIREALRKLGYRSKILVTYREHALIHECEVLTEEAVKSSAALIYHHSIGTEITGYVRRFRGPKALVYHNITPAEFYDAYSPVAAARLRRGREELREMAPDFPIALGASRYNAAELAECGFRDPGVLPLCVDPQRWNIEPDTDTLAALSDGRTNVLFVGRISPNKKQDDLIKAFAAYLPLDPRARLILAGGCEAGDPYAAYLDELVHTLGLAGSVLRPGFIPDSQLLASYQTAHLFWSMSEHEGFCVPLIEAMLFDVPVFAYDSTAIPETLADAGQLFHDKSDTTKLAARVHQLVHDAELREKILQAQRSRRADFLPENFMPVLERLANELSSSAGATQVPSRLPISLVAELNPV